MIGEPLSTTGVTHFSATCALPGVTTTSVGATGAPTVTASLMPDVMPGPFALSAVTVKVYVVPLLSPVT